MSKEKPIFFQNPFDLDKDPRIQKLKKKMWATGYGIFCMIQKSIHLGKGQYPLSGIQQDIAGADKAKLTKVNRVISDFGLFVLENGMVRLAAGLTASEMNPRGRTHSPAQDQKTLQKRLQTGYEGTIFPDYLQQNDEQQLQVVQSEINEQNRMELLRM